MVPSRWRPLFCCSSSCHNESVKFHISCAHTVEISFHSSLRQNNLPPPHHPISDQFQSPQFSQDSWNALLSMMTSTRPSNAPHPPGLSFSDQFVFQPAGSTTCALIQLFHTISALLESNPNVIVIALDFSKASDSVRHSAVLGKFSRLNIPDNVYNLIESYFRGHSHCTNFGHECSGFQERMASIIHGSSIGPASYVVTASDLFALTLQQLDGQICR
jgi:Reverse transcriptase (RNA-dependent DNA polymerase)